MNSNSFRVKLLNQTQNLILINIYFSHSWQKELNEELIQIINYFEKKQIIIGGDFNFPFHLFLKKYILKNRFPKSFKLIPNSCFSRVKNIDYFISNCKSVL
ncbi:hypothetical protein M0811_11608 [Anaeramoeba ignava]|uniref:Endonuclease/exonuclease/phosphatase domain-containing protein n=1 Tax=Anaeramoeba ignava TaxID=1746090 RepID=A0A9Q0LB37_ANAIG|nr:hypothetical protein M0811_11608 [Anaeramoeba ignava]